MKILTVAKLSNIPDDNAVLRDKILSGDRDDRIFE